MRIESMKADNEFGHDRQYPIISALIEGMLLDINGWLSRCGVSYRLPTLFRPGAIFTDSRK